MRLFVRWVVIGFEIDCVMGCEIDCETGCEIGCDWLWDSS